MENWCLNLSRFLCTGVTAWLSQCCWLCNIAWRISECEERTVTKEGVNINLPSVGAVSRLELCSQRRLVFCSTHVRQRGSPVSDRESRFENHKLLFSVWVSWFTTSWNPSAQDWNTALNPSTPVNRWAINLSLTSGPQWKQIHTQILKKFHLVSSSGSKGSHRHVNLSTNPGL